MSIRETWPRSMPAQRISLLVSDVDGTLVTHDKVLMPATIEAAHRLKDRGLRFAIVSSHPPRGLAMLADPLDLEVFGGFNGAAIVRSDLTPIEEHFVPLEAGRLAVDLMRDDGTDIWVFSQGEWLITNPQGAYVP